MELLINTKTTEYSVISICTILLFPLHSTDFIDGTMPETPQLMSSKNGLEKPVLSPTNTHYSAHFKSCDIINPSSLI